MLQCDSLDTEQLSRELAESARLADGVRFADEQGIKETISLIEAAWNCFKDKPIQEGEFVKIGEQYRRVAHVLQYHADGSVTLQCADAGSWYLAKGHGSFSGSLDYPVTVKPSPVGMQPAPFWIFWRGHAGARCGVHFTLPTRVFNS